jgi:hypothetical protein
VSCEALADDSAARIVKRYARRVGLDDGAYSGHSLRSGFLTSAAESGASVFKMTEVSRHRSLDTLRGYVGRVDLFKEHAVAAFPVGSVPEMAVWLQARRLASHSPGECLLARLSGGTLWLSRVATSRSSVVLSRGAHVLVAERTTNGWLPGRKSRAGN